MVNYPFGNKDLKAAQYLQNNPPHKELKAIHLGRLIVEIKKHTNEEMEEMDRVVKKLLVKMTSLLIILLSESKTLLAGEREKKGDKGMSQIYYEL